MRVFLGYTEYGHFELTTPFHFSRNQARMHKDETPAASHRVQVLPHHAGTVCTCTHFFEFDTQTHS